MRWWIPALGLCLGMTACSYPVEQVRTTDERPGLLIQGAPPDAIVLVDGLAAGQVYGAGGVAQIIRIEPGTHAVAVSANGQTLMSERIFASDGSTKTLTLPAGAIRP
jgi:hypothetical protein